MKWFFAASVVIVLAVVGHYATGEAAAALLVGWASFFARVIPQVRIHWPTVVMGLAAFVTFIFGLHWFLSQFTSQGASSVGRAPRRWRFRWTAAAVAMTIVTFAAGISLVGIVHQISWLASSDQPSVGESISHYPGQDARGNLKMLSLGINTAESALRRLPPSASLSPSGQALHGWELHILPFIPYMTSDIDRDKEWCDLVNQKYFKCIIPDFINPEFRVPELEDKNGYGLNHFSANSRLFAPGQSMRHQDIDDGAANTILLGEVNANFSPWGRPNNVRDPAAGVNRGPDTFGGPPNRRGAIFAMADGSVRLISDDVDPDVLRALSTPDGGDNDGVEGE